jgi:hypothetical protein
MQALRRTQCPSAIALNADPRVGATNVSDVHRSGRAVPAIKAQLATRGTGRQQDNKSICHSFPRHGIIMRWLPWGDHGRPIAQPA